MTPPLIDRPRMPPGYGVPSNGNHLEWEMVEQRLVESLHYWVATTRPDGRPHVVPRWGVWLDGVFWYDGSPETRHVRNLTSNDHVALHLEEGAGATIVYGRSVAADPVTGDLGQRLSAEFGRKYAPTYTPGPQAWSDQTAGGLRHLRPDTALAWSQFPVDVTRFTFPDDVP